MYIFVTFQDYVVGGNGYLGIGGKVVGSNGMSVVAGADPATTASLAALTAASNHNFSPTSAAAAAATAASSAAAAAAAKQTAADLMKQHGTATILHSTAHHNQVGPTAFRRTTVFLNRPSLLISTS